MCETGWGMFCTFRASFQVLRTSCPFAATIEVTSHLLLLCLFLPPYHFQLWSVPLSGQAFQEAAVLFLISNIF